MPPAPDHPIVRARWLILAIFVAACAWLLPGVQHTREDDDVLAFLPQDDPDVQSFNEVAARFGMLEVALVGLTAADGDVLSVARVGKIRTLVGELRQVPGVRMVLSFVDLPNPKVTADGLEVAELVPEAMSDAAAIRERVLGSENAVGNLISADGRAAALLVYLLHVEGQARTEQRGQVLAAIRTTVEAHWPGDSYFGGAPFVENTAAESSRTDINALSPVVIAVLVVVSAILLRSVTAALLNLIIAGLGVGLVMGAHGQFDEPLTIVSSTIPVMMVALGGAFGVHMLAGYQRQTGTSRARASAAVRELWLPVVLSGLTTSVAFFALLVMPQVPMQRFGVVAGLGVLLLLGLALVVLPGLFALLPESVLRPLTDRHVPFRVQPPTWALALVALLGVGLGLRLEADPNTSNVFDPESEPRRADAFFNEHFGGSTYLQVAVEGDLSEPVVLREIRDIADAARRVEGVIDVRTLVEPVALLTEALGGRSGVPATQKRTSRVLTYLVGHPAMAQLMATDRNAALIHVKLAPLDGPGQVVATDAIRSIVSEHGAADGLGVGSTTDEAIVAAQREAVRRRVSMLLDKEIEPDAFARALEGAPTKALLEEVRKLRDQALDSDDSPVEGVPREEIDSIEPGTLVQPRGKDLEALLRERLPTLVANDPEGIRFVADHLGAWVDEAIGKHEVAQRCGALGLAEGEACAAIEGTLAELGDDEWLIPSGLGAAKLRSVAFDLRLTGQPVIGQAFARSVTWNLRTATLVSIAALIVMLLLSRQIAAVVPALWTLTVTAGAISLLGHPISIGTSMVACIALGAGVDFAIHIGVRARRIGDAERAAEEIGAVVLISGLQLAMAFLVLLASQMPPLREFGAGLAIGLLGAALGSVWLTPRLSRPAKRKKSE